MEDVVMTMEIDADFEHNPLLAEVATLWSEAVQPNCPKETEPGLWVSPRGP
jgi:hypothetical protein